MEKHSPPIAEQPDFKAFRLKLGLKQKAVADLLDVDQATVSRWESGRTPVDLHLLKQLQRIELPPGSPGPARSSLVEDLEAENYWPNLLRFHRITRQFSQEQLSEVVGCSVETISRWERGLFRPDLTWQRRLRDLILKPLEADNALLHMIRRVEASQSMMNLCLDHHIIAYSSPLRKFAINANYRADKFQCVLDLHDGVYQKGIQTSLDAGFERGEVQIARSYLRSSEQDSRRLTWFPLSLNDGRTAAVVFHHQLDFSRYGRRHQEHVVNHADTLIG